MRAIALAAIVGAALTGVAAAETWNDPNGRVSFNKPSGWGVETAGSTGTQTAVLTFNASNDCYIFGLTNPASADRSANDARNATAAMTPEQWATAASAGQMRRDFFPSGASAPVSTSVDTSGFWPVQRAQFQGPAPSMRRSRHGPASSCAPSARRPADNRRPPSKAS